MSRVPLHKWALDPLYSTYVPLFIKSLQRDVSVIKDYDHVEIYLFKRPIRKVSLYGIVVEKYTRSKQNAQKVIMKLDDGSGVVECHKYIRGTTNTLECVTNGDFVHVKGVLLVINGELIVQAAIIEISTDPNAESLHAMNTIKMYQTEYKKELNFSRADPSTSPAAGPSRYHRLPLPCSCMYHPPKQFASVRRNLLFCPCIARVSNLDPQGWVRLSVLRYILRVHSALSGLSTTGGPPVLCMADLLIDPWLLKCVEKEMAGYITALPTYLTFSGPSSASSVHSSDKEMLRNAPLSSRSDGCAGMDSRFACEHHSENDSIPGIRECSMGVDGECAKSPRVVQECAEGGVQFPSPSTPGSCGRARHMLSHLFTDLCQEGILLPVNPLYMSRSTASSSKCDGDLPEAVQLATVDDVLLPLLTSKVTGISDIGSGNDSSSRVEQFISTARHTDNYQKIPAWRWKLCWGMHCDRELNTANEYPAAV